MRNNPKYVGPTFVTLLTPHWARTQADMILFAGLDDSDQFDVYCIERSTGRIVNLTQHLDDESGVKGRYVSGRWLPDDSGMLVIRIPRPDQSLFHQLLEMRFGDDYDPASGCPSETQMANASVVVLAQDEGGREMIGFGDYWRNAPRTPAQ